MSDQQFIPAHHHRAGLNFWVGVVNSACESYTEPSHMLMLSFTHQEKDKIAEAFLKYEAAKIENMNFTYQMMHVIDYLKPILHKQARRKG
jgi:hypothetical protein